VFRDTLKLKAKAVLTLLTVAVGVAVLILAVGISDTFSRTVTSELTSGGLIVNVANATFSDEGGLEIQRPPQFDENVLDLVAVNLPGVAAVTPLGPSRWREITVGEQTYQLRRVVGSDGSYVQVMKLKIIAGRNFAAEDVSAGTKTALITESMAVALFGSADAAVGETFRPPVMSFVVRTPGGVTERSQVADVYEIIGVYADPPEVQRRAYGIADLVTPFTSVLPSGPNLAIARRFLLSTIAIRVEGIGFDAVESQLRAVLAAEYGEDVAVHVWEGSRNGETNTLEETRQTVATFSLVVNLLGFVLLVTGSIGILSIMIVEVLGRSREIALERALGANKRDIVREFFLRAVVMSSLSAAVGVALSFAFSRPLSSLLWPIFAGIGVTTHGASSITPLAVAVGVVSAVIVGGIFGTMPVFSTLKPPIAESIREG
jgi:putative ABC transport system permease protein